MGRVRERHRNLIFRANIDRERGEKGREEQRDSETERQRQSNLNEVGRVRERHRNLIMLT